MANNVTKILFMGTSDFGIPALDAIVQIKDVVIIGCVTAPDSPVGRKQELTSPPVKVWAQTHHVPVFQPSSVRDPQSIETIRRLAPDLILVAAYGQIIPREIISLPLLGAINVHPSLLPRWRGASPIQYAILSGDATTGVALIQMDERLDHGPVVTLQEFTLKGTESFEELYTALQHTARDLVVKTLPLLQTKKITPAPQDEAEATYAKILTREDGKINWSQDARDIERQIRAFERWPESFTEWRKNEDEIVKIKITRASVASLEKTSGKEHPYGQIILAPDKRLLVQTGKDYLALEKIKPEGKNEMSAEDFVNGYPSVIGTTFV